MLHTYASTDVRRVLAESVDKCGFEAYRLLTREYDPVTTDIAYQLTERILVIARWQVKTIDDEVGALREALKRVRELERRCKDEDTPAMRRMIAGVLYANVLQDFLERLRQKAPLRIGVHQAGWRALGS